jgi:hypothetical protein
MYAILANQKIKKGSLPESMGGFVDFEQTLPILPQMVEDLHIRDNLQMHKSPLFKCEPKLCNQHRWKWRFQIKS